MGMMEGKEKEERRGKREGGGGGEGQEEEGMLTMHIVLHLLPGPNVQGH